MESKTFDDALDEKLIDLVRINPVLYQLSSKNNRDRALRDVLWREISLSLGRSVSECKTRWRTIRDSYRKMRIKNQKLGQKIGFSAYPKSKYNSENFAFLDASLEEITSRTSLEKSHMALPEEEYQEITKSELPDNILEIMIDNEAVAVSDQSEDLKCPSDNPEAATRTKLGSKRSHLNSSMSSLNASMQNIKRSKNNNEKIDEIHKNRDVHWQILQEQESLAGAQADPAEDPIYTFFRSMAATVKTFPPHLVAETRMKVCNVITEMELRALSD